MPQHYSIPEQVLVDQCVLLHCSVDPAQQIGDQTQPLVLPAVKCMWECFNILGEKGRLSQTVILCQRRNPHQTNDLQQQQ